MSTDTTTDFTPTLKLDNFWSCLAHTYPEKMIEFYQAASVAQQQEFLTEVRGPEQRTAILLATVFQDFTAFDFLLHQGSDLRAQDLNGRNVLHTCLNEAPILRATTEQIIEFTRSVLEAIDIEQHSFLLTQNNNAGESFVRLYLQKTRNTQLLEDTFNRIHSVEKLKPIYAQLDFFLSTGNQAFYNRKAQQALLQNLGQRISTLEEKKALEEIVAPSQNEDQLLPREKNCWSKI